MKKTLEGADLITPLLILSAGVIFNMLFAFGAYTYVIAEWGVPELSTTRIGIVHDEFLPPGD